MDEQPGRMRVLDEIRRRQQHAVGIRDLAISIQIFGLAIRSDDLR